MLPDLLSKKELALEPGSTAVGIGRDFEVAPKKIATTRDSSYICRVPASIEVSAFVGLHGLGLADSLLAIWHSSHGG
jgi:hypothetical protein